MSNNKEWYEKTTIIALLLMFVFPLGLYLMWKYANWKKWIKIVISVFMGFIVVSVLANPDSQQTKNTNKQEVKKVENNTEQKSAEEPKTPPHKSEEKKPDVPTEYKSALNKADSYANRMYMSKQGVYEQLTSAYGEKFSAPAAQYAIDNVKADWNANAVVKAKTYQDQMSMSPAAIHDQLTSAYGEKFTKAEADYAIAHLND